MSSERKPVTQLRIPGPTPIPDRVLQVSSAQMINHRGTEFAELLTEIVTNLQYVLHTANEVLLFPSSGTGGLEAAVVNLLSPGETTLVCVSGSFGKRWADIADAYGAKAVRVKSEPGTPVTPAAVEEALQENPSIRKVFVTHNETSTGVTSDVAGIAEVAKRHGALIAVDSVSGAGCIPLEVDGLDLDVVVTGSQKGWMSPPGLSMISVSKAAFAAAEEAKIPRWYFDFAREKKYQDQAQTYITPPLSVMYSLREGLRMIREEGVDETWARHARIAGTIRAGAQEYGLELLAAEGCRSNTVTAVKSPADSPAALKEFTNYLKNEEGVEVAGGQDDLKGKIFRIGHLGWITDSDADVILAAVRAGLTHFDLGGSALTAEPAGSVA